jgi:hypothetical protein
VNVTTQWQGLCFKDELAQTRYSTGYDYDYASNSRHQSKSVSVSAVDANININANYKSPVSVPVRPAIASALTSTLASAFHFGGERMIRAQTGSLVPNQNYVSFGWESRREVRYPLNSELEYKRYTTLDPDLVLCSFARVPLLGKQGQD